MAVQSQRTPLGTPLPDLTLNDVDDRSINLPQYRGADPLVVVFACNHCPYVRHVENQLATVADEYAAKGVRFVAIMSNDTSTHPSDGPEGMRDQIERAGWRFPYLSDPDQTAALNFGAACTPDFFGYGADGLLAYRGAFDPSTPRNGEPCDGSLLRAALDTVLSGQPVPEPQRPAMGCGIKWLPGNEPEAISFV